MNFSPVSSILLPVTLMRDSVSGTWEMQTTEFKQDLQWALTGAAGAAFYEGRHANRKRIRTRQFESRQHVETEARQCRW